MNTNLTVVNDYSLLPIPLILAKSFLRVEHTNDDSLIAFFIQSAINYAENKLNIVVGKKDYKYTIYGDGSSIVLPKFPISSINSVTIDGVGGTFQRSGNCITILQGHNGKIVEIIFTCENIHFGEAVQVAILRHVFFLYENRSVTEVNSKEIESIYRPLILNNYNI